MVGLSILECIFWNDVKQFINFMESRADLFQTCCNFLFVFLCVSPLRLATLFSVTASKVSTTPSLSTGQSHPHQGGPPISLCNMSLRRVRRRLADRGTDAQSPNGSVMLVVLEMGINYGLI